MKYIKNLLLAFLFTFSLNQNLFAEFGDDVKVDSSTRIDIGDAFNQVQDGAPFYGGTSTGAANVYTLTFSAANEPDNLPAGSRFYFLSHQANSGNITVNVGAFSKSLRLIDGSTQVPSGSIKSGDSVEIFYDGTNFRLVSINNAVFQVNAIQTAIPTLQAFDTNITQGWTTITESWAYASASTITVPTGAASRYQKGDKLWFTNSGTKYFYIIGVADTVLTVTGGTDYTVANAAISAIYLSRVENPFGFPVSFTYTVTPVPVAGSASGVNNIYSEFSIKGRSVCVQVVVVWTQNSASATYVVFNLPVTPNATNQVFAVMNNTDGSNYAGYAYINSTSSNGSVLITPYANGSGFLTGSRSAQVAGCYYF